MCQTRSPTLPSSEGLPYGYVDDSDRLKAERRQGHGAQELVWHPGECQADFGECDMYVRGSRVVVQYLVVTFPYSNVGYLQCFHGETAE